MFDKIIGENIGKNAIDFLEQHSCDSKSINIGFYGETP